MKNPRLKAHEALFLFAGIGTIVVLPWFETVGTFSWYITKSAYLLGLISFIKTTLYDRD